MAALADRLESARGIADGRRIIATSIESRLHTRFTYDTLRALRLRFPRAGFVWLMGADNLVQLPRWQHWTGIARTMPVAVMPRPTYNQRALSGQAAHRLRHALRDSRESPLLATLPAPAWTFLPAKQNPSSATAIRERGRAEPQLAWPRPPPPLPPALPMGALPRRPGHATTPP